MFGLRKVSIASPFLIQVGVSNTAALEETHAKVGAERVHLAKQGAAVAHRADERVLWIGVQLIVCWQNGAARGFSALRRPPLQITSRVWALGNVKFTESL